MVRSPWPSGQGSLGDLHETISVNDNQLYCG
jgi:hypothetical protein